MVVWCTLFGHSLSTGMRSTSVVDCNMSWRYLLISLFVRSICDLVNVRTTYGQNKGMHLLLFRMWFYLLLVNFAVVTLDPFFPFFFFFNFQEIASSEEGLWLCYHIFDLVDLYKLRTSVNVMSKYCSLRLPAKSLPRSRWRVAVVVHWS